MRFDNKTIAKILARIVTLGGLMVFSEVNNVDVLNIMNSDEFIFTLSPRYKGVR